MNKSWIIQVGKECGIYSVEDLINLDTKIGEYKVLLSLPFEKPPGFEEREEEPALLFEKLKKEVEKDLRLKRLIDELKEKMFTISYKNSKGEEVETSLLHQIEKAYQNQFHEYEVVSNPIIVEEIKLGLQEVVKRENVAETFSRLVDEKEIPFFGNPDYKIKWQAEKLMNPPLKLAYLEGNSVKLRESDGIKFLKHLYTLFGVKEREYKLKQDYSPEIVDAIMDMREYLFPEFF